MFVDANVTVARYQLEVVRNWPHVDPVISAVGCATGVGHLVIDVDLVWNDDFIVDIEQGWNPIGRLVELAKIATCRVVIQQMVWIALLVQFVCGRWARRGVAEEHVKMGGVCGSRSPGCKVGMHQRVRIRKVRHKTAGSKAAVKSVYLCLVLVIVILNDREVLNSRLANQRLRDKSILTP